MDQSASVLSLEGSALYVSFKPTLTARPVYFPTTDPELSFVIAQSFVTSNKHVTGPVCYNLRVVECSLAAAYLHAVASKSHSIPALKGDSGPLGISLRGFHESYFDDSKVEFAQQLEQLIAITKKKFTKRTRLHKRGNCRRVGSKCRGTREAVHIYLSRSCRSLQAPATCSPRLL